MKEEKLEKLILCVRVLKQANPVKPVSEMTDAELHVNLALCGCEDGDENLSSDEIAFVRRALAMKV